MSYMKPLDEFEPGATTKNLLLYVNKKEKNITGTHWPGLFGDTHYVVMVIFAMLALGLEWLGLVFIIDKIELGVIQGLMAVSVLILLDVALAFFLHLKSSKLCLYENKKLVLKLIVDNDAEIQAKNADYNSRIFRAKALGFLFTLLIWVIAAIKSLLFYSLEIVDFGEIDSKAIFIFATYIFVALIHVNFTGYALFGALARIAWWFSERKYISSGRTENKAQKRKEDIVTRALLLANNEDQRQGPHTLEKLISVDLVYRDADKKARAQLGPSALTRLKAILQKDIDQEYRERRKIPSIEIPDYQHEIDDSVRDQIAAMLKVSIDPQTMTGVLTAELKHFLQNALTVAPDIIQELEKGQILYRLTASGLLLDDELSSLANTTTDGQGRIEIASHGLHLQLQML